VADEGLWARSEVMPDGSYGVGINVGADRAWTLDPSQAVAYAVACVTRATEAEHDAAVFAAMQAAGLDQKAAAMFIVKDLRPDRPSDHSATEPLQFHTALGLKAGPFIKMDLDGELAGEMTPGDLIDHAMGVLKTLAAADLDAALKRTLSGSVGLDDDRARAVVGLLAQHWPRSEVRRA
jgi:hypothetical protein